MVMQTRKQALNSLLVGGSAVSKHAKNVVKTTKFPRIMKVPPLIRQRWDHSAGMSRQVEKASNLDLVMANGDGSDSSAVALETFDGKHAARSGLPIQTRPVLRLQTVDMLDVYAHTHYLGVPCTFASLAVNDGASTTSDRGCLSRFTRNGVNVDTEEGMKVKASQLQPPCLLWQGLSRLVVGVLTLAVDGTIESLRKLIEYGCVRAFCIGYGLGGALLVWNWHV